MSSFCKNVNPDNLLLFFLHHWRGHWGGWARRRQHICCIRNIGYIMDGWAGLCHTRTLIKFRNSCSSIVLVIHRPDIEVQENFLLQRVQKKILSRKLFIRTILAARLKDKILVRKCRSEDFGDMRSQKDLNSNFMLPEGFRTFCRSGINNTTLQ